MSADISAQVDDLIKDFRSYGEKVYTNVGKAVLKGCLTVERAAKESIVGPSNEVSEPGEPPKIKTGRLRASITHRVMYEDGQVVGEVGTNVEYALPLEFGREFGTSKMAPRPFLGPALDENAEEINEAIEKAEMEAEGAFHA
jgi:HK97 gp10 family phage protein